METLYIKDDFIRLGQALKLSGLAESGVDAKMMILNALVQVNGTTEVQRGKKLYPGDVVTFQEESFQIGQ